MARKTCKPAIMDIGSDLVITDSNARQVGGTWVSGTIAGHSFDALVFAEHAEFRDDEIGDSKISKLSIFCGNREVYSWDRGLDQPATTQAAQEIVDFLAAGLADHVFAAA